jgi:hypothetical protein
MYLGDLLSDLLGGQDIGNLFLLSSDVHLAYIDLESRYHQ